MQSLRPTLALGSTLLIAVLICALPITAQTLTTIHHFTGSAHNDGATPFAGVVIGPGDALYGTTTYGGATDCFAGCGTVFELTPPASPGGVWPETLYLFPGHHAGLQPQGGVIIGEGAVLYGTDDGGTCCGVVFALTPPASPGGSITRKVLHNFAGSPGDGTAPLGSLVMGSDGIFYGATQSGGLNCSASGPPGCGTIYSLTPPAAPGGAWTEKVLYSFTGGADGGSPRAGVVIGPNGVLYGTTQAGGSGRQGTVFSLTPPSTPNGAWTENVLHSFAGGSDGIQPFSPVVIGSKGLLYGTTSAGGASTCGVVFSLTPPASQGGAWTENILYTFTGHNDGCAPNGVIVGSGGVLYGPAAGGGASRWGTLFSLHPPTSQGGSWTQTVLYTFTGTIDGGSPYGVVLGANGALYGTTSGGGVASCNGGCGTVFVLRP